LTFMAQVFISHSSRDAAFVLSHIKPALDRAGVDAWFSATDIRVAADWERQIRTALSQADWFVVVLSPDAERSDWVQSETHWALEHLRGRIIPVMARACDPCQIHLRLGTIQYIDFREDPGTAAARLIALVSGQEPDQGPDPAPRLSAASPDLTAIIRDIRQADLSLFIELPSGPGFEHLLRVERSAMIGRADTADLQLADDCISRRHARIAVLPADPAPFVALSDLNSANGTFVNHDRILSEQRLAEGDLIELGNTRLHIRAINKFRTLAT
jgi:hypothetical protein